jgi:2-phospho-L-lactate guanylyltransferase
VRVLAIPVKALGRAKGRLAPVLAPAERAELVLAMLEDVLDAGLGQDGWTPLVVTADPRAATAAAARRVPALVERGRSLGEAVRQVEREAAADAEALAVVLADLPWLDADQLRGVLGASAQVVAAPSIDGGTNVLVRRPAAAIPARFGRSSFARHRWEAEHAGLSFAEVRSDALAFDLDRPQDLLRLAQGHVPSRARAICLEWGLPDRLSLAAGA